jgi:NTE family protein
MGFFSWLVRRKKPKALKLGIALGSGGAKGYAELGALKAFEENGIEFDCIAGTSIGSIIGAFYAAGYTCTDIFEMLKRIDFGEIKNLFMMNMDTSGLFSVIDREIGSLNIEELKKPFKCVATEIESGDEFVFDSGSVAKALCASSCMPPFFKPVVIGDKRFVDGAYSNSIPADLVRGMGADFVVGIDLSTRDAKPNPLLKLFPTYKGKVEEPWKKGYENSDIMLHPDLSDYTSVSFFKGSEMFDIGYSLAIEKMPEIKKAIEELKTKR